MVCRCVLGSTAVVWRPSHVGCPHTQLYRAVTTAALTGAAPPTDDAVERRAQLVADRAHEALLLLQQGLVENSTGHAF